MSRQDVNIRASAAKALHQIVSHNRTIDWALERGVLDDPATAAIVYESLRYYPELNTRVMGCLERPPRDKDLDIYALMIVGAYQLADPAIPDYAAINETVNATRQLKKPWAKGLVNAVLRKLAAVDLAKRTFEHHNHSAWLADELHRDFPEHAPALMRANNQRAPMCLRVNLHRISAEDYRKQLDQADIAYRTFLPELPETLILHDPVPADTLPGWEDGLVAIQDCGAQLAAVLALNAAQSPLRVLDACAAPGGKLFHILERHGKSDIDVTALEVSERRANTMRKLGHRLGHEVDVTVEDARFVSTDTPYSLILLDVPCSGTGTLRRHPEIKIQLDKNRLDDLVATQRELLESLWSSLASGGTLLYCTCSLLHQENDATIQAFLSANENNNAQILPVSLPLGNATEFGWQLTPLDDTDGFYFCLLRKPAPDERVTDQPASIGLT